MNRHFPEWLKVKAPRSYDVEKIKKLNIITICEESKCPNRAICYSKSVATFMILGKNCTRMCKYCNVIKNNACSDESFDIEQILYAIEKLDLKHVVITSVTRDDLYDGGAEYFARLISVIKENFCKITIEVLIPDFFGKEIFLKDVVLQSPDIIGHNIDIVKSLYPKIKPGASYKRSINVLQKLKQLNESIFTKSFIMVGLGEKFKEIIAVMNDLKEAKCDILMIGQYLRPGLSNLDVVEYVNPEIFRKYELMAKKLKFKYIVSGPFVRSSYNSYEILNDLRIK